MILQAIPPLEFAFKEDRFSLAFVEAAVYKPVVAKGSICREMKVYPAECRGRKCTYKGKIVVSPTRGKRTRMQVQFYLFISTCLSSQADVSWSINGVPKGIIKQSLGQVPIMVKSKMCNLQGMSPTELVKHHEEAEVRRTR